jgi:hypothetical protein
MQAALRWNLKRLWAVEALRNPVNVLPSSVRGIAHVQLPDSCRQSRLTTATLYKMLGGYNRLTRPGRLHCASAHVHLAIGILADDIAALGNSRRRVHARSCILAARREQTDQLSCGHCRPLLHLPIECQQLRMCPA